MCRVVQSTLLLQAIPLGEGQGEGSDASRTREPSRAGSPISAASAAMRTTRSKPTSATPANSGLSRRLLGAYGVAGGLDSVTPRDFRNFMATRRDDGTGSRSLARTLSALRSLFRYLERTGVLQNRSVLSVALPKLPPRLPKPLTDQGEGYGRRGHARRRAERSSLDRAAQSGRAVAALWLGLADLRSARP